MQDNRGAMITIDQALAIIQANRPRRQVEEIALDQALGRYLAAEVKAVEPSPRFTNSAMDGFAVRWDDIQGAPVRLTIVGESRAGVPFYGEVGPGEAIRISTGAMLPPAVDTVVRAEEATDLGAQLLVNQVGARHRDVRFQGEELRQGDPLLAMGSALSPPRIALLAAQGISMVPVFSRPRVALVVTGSELVADSQPAPHQIRDSNRIMLHAAITQAGGDLVHCHWTGDEYEQTVTALAEAMESARLILCSGGVSVGAHDHVRQAAESLGFAQLFWRVRQKPGKPLYCGRRQDTLLFGLPGNPVSALMCFTYYLQPLIAHLLGRESARQRLQAQAGCEVANRGGRPALVTVQLTTNEEGQTSFQPAGNQGSHRLTSIARADGFVLVPEHTTLPAGSWQEVSVFPWR